MSANLTSRAHRGRRTAPSPARPPATSGRSWSASRSTASWPPPPSSSAAAPTSSATSPTPTSARCASACPARCRCSTARSSSWPCASVGPSTARVEPSVFARKNYFYPDMPKDYQVTQFDRPINVDGWLDLPDGTRVGIERAHIEEDTGKNTHAGGGGRIHDADYSLVDYNRAGVPLVEIVGRPDIRTAEQAKAYVDELRAILAGHRCLRRQDGGGLAAGRRQRVGAPGRRPRARHALRDQERQLAALARPGHRVRGPSPDRPARDRRAGAAGDPPLGRGRRPHPPGPLQGGGRRLPLLPRARPGAARARRPSGSPRSTPRCRCCRPTAAPRLAEAAGRRPPSRRGRRTCERDLDDLALARHRRRWRRRPGAAPTSSTTWPSTAPSRSTRPTSPSSSRMEVGGRAHRHPGQDRARPRWSRPGRPPTTSPPSRASRPWTPATLEGIVDGIIAENPDEWADFCGGDDKAGASSRASSSARS